MSAFLHISDLPHGVQAGFFLLLGLVIGSFLNVIIVRLPKGRSIIQPSSRCGFCRSSIPWFMNIPLMSFVVTAGKCIKCGSYYSARYPLIELLTGIFFVSIWSVYGWTILALIYALFTAALIAITFIDLEYRIIPDSLSLGGWVVGLGLALVAGDFYPLSWVESLVGSFLGYVAFWLLARIFYQFYQEEGLGGGDVKLMGFIGAFLGVRGVFSSILVGSLLGCLVGILVIGVRKRSRKFPIPFGPFLAIGALSTLFHLDFWWIP